MALVALALCRGRLHRCRDARGVRHSSRGRRSSAPRRVERVEIRHVPSRWPEGCAGSYTLHIGKGSATADGNGNFHINRDADGLSVRCYNSSGNPHAWGTTYHLRFVDVPEVVEIEKPDGAAAVIEVERKSRPARRGEAALNGRHDGSALLRRSPCLVVPDSRRWQQRYRIRSHASSRRRRRSRRW